MNPSILKRAVIRGVITGSLLALVAWGIQHFRKAPMIEAQRELQEHRPYHAAQLLKDHRSSVSQTQQGCALAFRVFSQLKQGEDLGWYLEACRSLSFLGPELFLAQAGALQARSKDEEAVQLLQSAGAQYPGNPMVYVRLAQIFEEHQQTDKAKASWRAAIDQAPNDGDTLLGAFAFYFAHKIWKEAATVAQKLQVAPELAKNQELQNRFKTALQEAANAKSK